MTRTIPPAARHNTPNANHTFAIRRLTLRFTLTVVNALERSIARQYDRLVDLEQRGRH